MKKLILILILGFTINHADAQILSWNYLTDVKGNEKTSSSTTTHDLLETSILSRGPAVKPERATYSYAGAFPSDETKEDAIEAGSYYQFTVKAKKGNKVSLSSLRVVLRAQPNAPKKYRWMYSLNGKDFEQIGNEDLYCKSSGNNGSLQPIVNLSAIDDLQKVSSKKTITFRLYAWGGINGKEKNGFRIGKSSATRDALNVNGIFDKE